MNATERLDKVYERYLDWYDPEGRGEWTELDGEAQDMRSDTVEQQVYARQIVREDVPALVAALRAVLDLHTLAWDSPSDEVWATNPKCRAEGNTYPCPTVRAITAALDGAE